MKLPSSAHHLVLRRLTLLTAIVGTFTSPLVLADTPLASRVFSRQAMTQTLALDGVVEAVQQATVAPQIAGRIVQVLADAGASVKQGQVLMRLEAQEANEAVAGANAQYLNAKANYERTQRLVQQKFLSQAALDKAKADFDAAAAGRGSASAGQAHATITAPISGVVAQRHAEQGEMATPGRPLFTLYAPGGLRVTVNLPQQIAAQSKDQIKNNALQAGQIKLELPETKQWLTPASVQLLPAANASTHTTPLRVNLPNLANGANNGANPAPGSFARVHLPLGNSNKASVPQTAVVQRSEMMAVYVLNKDHYPLLRQVRVGEKLSGDEVEILAGLGEGENVCTDAKQAAQWRAAHPLSHVANKDGK